MSSNDNEKTDVKKDEPSTAPPPPTEAETARLSQEDGKSEDKQQEGTKEAVQNPTSEGSTSAAAENAETRQNKTGTTTTATDAEVDKDKVTPDSKSTRPKDDETPPPPSTGKQQQKNGEGDEMMYLVEQLLDEQEKVRVLTEELEKEKRRLQLSEARSFLTQLREAATTPWSSELLHAMQDSFRRVHQEGATVVFRSACRAIAHLVSKAKRNRAISLGALKASIVDFLTAHDSDVSKRQMLENAVAAQQNGGESKVLSVVVPGKTGTGLMATCEEEFDQVVAVRVEVLSLLTQGAIPEECLTESNGGGSRAGSSEQNSNAVTPEKKNGEGAENHINSRNQEQQHVAATDRTPPPPLRLIAPAKRIHTSLLLPVSGRPSSSTPRPRLNAMSSAMSPPPSVVFTVESKKVHGPVSNNVRSRYADPHQSSSSSATCGQSSEERKTTAAVVVATSSTNDGDNVRSSSSGRKEVRVAAGSPEQRGRYQGYQPTPGRRGAPMASEEEDEDEEWDRLASLAYRPRNTALDNQSKVVTTTSNSAAPRAGSALKKKGGPSRSPAPRSNGGTNNGTTTGRSASKPRHVGFSS